MIDRWLLVDVRGHIVGSTFSKDQDGLFRAVHPTTGEDWGVVELKPFDWPRHRVRIGDLTPLEVKPVRIKTA